MRLEDTRTWVWKNLSPTEWKTPIELAAQIGEQRRKEKDERTIPHCVFGFFSSTLEDLLWEPGSGTLYVVLAELEADGSVEARWRDDSPEVLRRRGGRRAREYRLTSSGHRRKAEILAKSAAANPALSQKPRYARGFFIYQTGV